MIYYISKAFWLIAAPTSALILINLVATFWAVLDGSTFAGWLAAAAACGLVIAAFTPIGFALMVPLENRFASLVNLQIAPDGIIFLTAPWPELAALNQRFPKARIIFSGYTVSGIDSENLLARLGIKPESVVQPRTTSEDALHCAALLEPKPSERWMLVTHAFHMPRAVGCFRAAGFRVEPYPVLFNTRPSISFYPPAPSSALETLDGAAKEWIGLIAYRVMGKTDALFPGPYWLGGCIHADLTLVQQLRQLRHVGRDPPRLIFCEQLGKRPGHSELLPTPSPSVGNCKGAISVLFAQEGWACGSPIMPTDLDQAFARKRAAQAKVQTEITMLLFWLIMCVGLLFEFWGSGS